VDGVGPTISDVLVGIAVAAIHQASDVLVALSAVAFGWMASLASPLIKCESIIYGRHGGPQSSLLIEAAPLDLTIKIAYS